MGGNADDEVLKHKLDVFISYSSKNKNVADAVVSEFEQHGIKCWYAPRDIMPGEEWVTAIKEGLTAAKIFVLIYTNESNDSRQVMNEVALAFNSGKTIVPFRLTEEVMNNELEYYLTRVHWLDAVTKPLKNNIEELRRYVDNILQHKPVDVSKNVQKAEPVKKKKKASGILIPVFTVLLILAGAFIVFVTVVPANNMKKGLEAYNSEFHSKDDDAAAREYFKKASMTKPDAYYYLGMLDERASDYSNAKVNYEIGARKGSILATERLGNLYFSGNGVSKDYREAASLFQKAETAGNVRAAYRLGYMFYFGYMSSDQKTPDYENAYKHFKQAADAGDADSLFMLGIMYYDGKYVEKDINAAKENYMKAIDAGSKNAPVNLGYIYFEEKDYGNARKYFEDKGGWELNAFAAYKLGKMYFDDTLDGGVIANDLAKAKKYMLKAEELGYSDEADLTAMYAEIASCLFDEEDYSRAAQYYIKAADSDQNNSNDARNAGFAFQCAKDYNNAVVCYSFALDRGYKGEHDLIAEIKDMNDKGLISKDTYEKYAKKWLEK